METANPRKEEFNKLLKSATEGLANLGAVTRGPDLLAPKQSALADIKDAVVTTLGGDKPTVSGELFSKLQKRLEDAWVARVKLLNWELEDRVGDAAVGALLDALRSNAKAMNLLALAKPLEDETLKTISDAEAPAFAKRTFLWPMDKAELVKELDSELQMPRLGQHLDSADHQPR